MERWIGGALRVVQAVVTKMDAKWHPFCRGYATIIE